MDRGGVESAGNDVNGGGGVGTATRFKWAALTTLTTKQAETGGETLALAPKALAPKAEQEARFVLVLLLQHQLSLRMTDR